MRIVVMVVVVAGVLVACGSTTSSDAPEAVVLEAAHTDGDDPFMANLADQLAFSDQALAATEAFRTHDDEPVAATSPGLFGGSGSDEICDVEAMIDILETDADLGSAWAEAAGLEVDQIATNLASWTPVLLSADTLVNRPGFVGGHDLTRRM